MDDRNCGTCSLWEPSNNAKGDRLTGVCTWHRTLVLPPWVPLDADRTTTRTDSCSMWKKLG